EKVVLVQPQVHNPLLIQGVVEVIKNHLLGRRDAQLRDRCDWCINKQLIQLRSSPPCSHLQSLRTFGRMAGGGEEHAAHSSVQDDAKDSESDGDAAEDILEESPCKRWSKRREQVKQRDVPGIDVAYLAMDNETGNEVVWNEVQFSERKNFRAQEEKINAVFDNLTQLVHTNLVKFHKYWTDAKSEKPRIIFITEYMSSGSMSLFLQRTRKSGSPLSIKAWKKWTTQILSALNYLHSCVPPITHGNLTCDTVFIQQNGLIKIGCVAPDAINHHVKTCRDNLKNMHYMAPEYEYCTEVTPAADIYSFGVCAVEIAVMGGLSGCQNGATDGPISRECIEKAVRSLEDEKQRDLIQLCLQKDPLKRPSARQLLFHPVLFEVHSLKLLSAHKIVDSKMFDDLPADAFRVPDIEKVAAVARREAGVREMAYCQVPAFQHDLEKIVEDVRNGIYPLTAFAPLAHQPLKATISQPSSRTAQAQTTTEGHEPSTSSLTTTSLPRAPETTDPVAASPPATDETIQHCETRAIRQMRVTTERNELTIWLQLEDMMNRQLTTEFSHDEDPNALTQDLVTHGFICESDAERLGAVLTAALKASADLAQSTGDDITTGSSMYALTEEAARRLNPHPPTTIGGGGGGAGGAPMCRVDPLNRTEAALSKLTFAEAPMMPPSS
ncbi:Nuclear receptor-binding, partial [Trichostrongylus colubriformis]